MTPPLQSHVSLEPYNTLAIPAYAEQFVTVTTLPELKSTLQCNMGRSPALILGGGSNVVLSQNVDGLVLHNKLKGISFQPQKEGRVLLEAAAGECWHDVVRQSVERGLCGIENLSLIPGTVGASPIQNIGAYGVELKDVFHSLEAMEISTAKMRMFSAEECGFGYRDSVFKGALANQFVITKVRLLLNQENNFCTGYGEIERYLLENNIQRLTPLIMSDVISAIRAAKLPDPNRLPNAGSFFKNPVVRKAQYLKLLELEPSLVSYPLPNGDFKLAAGWLIDKLGWKGKVLEGAKVHDNQALVLINCGGGGKAILRLAESIKRDVLRHFDVELEVEPVII